MQVGSNQATYDYTQQHRLDQRNLSTNEQSSKLVLLTTHQGLFTLVGKDNDIDDAIRNMVESFLCALQLLIVISLQIDLIRSTTLESGRLSLSFFQLLQMSQ